MSTKEKLLKKLFERKNLSFREMETLLKQLGFSCTRIRGDHFIYSRVDCPAIINIQPNKNGELKPYHIKQAINVIKEHVLKGGIYE